MLVRYKQILFTFILFLMGLGEVSGQVSQKLAYIDMNYILSELPEYQEAESELNKKIALWNEALSQLKSEIESMKIQLAEDRILLTDELLQLREDEIVIKEMEYKKIELSFFGPQGSLFKLRAQLVAPIQDQVYNAIQEIAKRGKYDFVIDKSSDLILLYSNKKYDISAQVVKNILQTEKQEEVEAARLERNSTNETVDPAIEQRQKALEAQRAAKLKAKAERDSILRVRKEARLKALQKNDSIN